MPDYLQVFTQYRRDLDGALRQFSDEEFSRSPGGSANSAAVIIRHLTGNFLSRFTDFLTTDGEKPWRQREAEFQPTEQSRQEIMQEFERAWQVLRETVSGLVEEDMQKTVAIRGNSLKVTDALLRSVAHFAGHVGQLIIIGKQFRGDDWEYLSIPPGGTVAYNASPDR